MKLREIKNSKAFNVHKKNYKYDFYKQSAFSIVEDHGFIEFLAQLNSRYVIPSAEYFNETMLQHAYNSLKL